jgi:hypothetical protein
MQFLAIFAQGNAGEAGKVMTILGTVATSTKSSYWLCVGLLVTTLLSQLAFVAQVPAPVRSVALKGVLFVAAVIVGVLLFSNFARYVGAIVLGALSLYVIYGFVFTERGPFPVPFQLEATIVAATGLELISAYLLGLSGSFSKEFKERRANAPAVVAHARLSILILLAVCVIAPIAHDIYRLVSP